ncbi:hypothetical protein AB0D46_07340 [Streptomyces sp. NPDC048383]|uniref:hypothetical protein n=1 Tax=Streptomyces sp. NPDC048383 TaxID=3155386 RepID=UPI003422094B
MRRTLTVVAAAAALLLPGGPLPAAGSASAEAAAGLWSSREAAAFWTPERMASALPMPDPVPDAPPGVRGAALPVPDPAAGGGLPEPQEPVGDGAVANGSGPDGSPTADAPADPAASGPAGEPPAGQDPPTAAPKGHDTAAGSADGRAAPEPGPTSASASASGRTGGAPAAPTAPAPTVPAEAAGQGGGPGEPIPPAPASATPATGSVPGVPEATAPNPAPALPGAPAGPSAGATPTGPAPALPDAPAGPSEAATPTGPAVPTPGSLPEPAPATPTGSAEPAPGATGPVPSRPAPAPRPAQPAPKPTPKPVAAPIPASARAGVGKDFGGSPAVGRMFVMKGGGAYFCTASVVSSPGRNLVLSAAHCLLGPDSRRVAFVPRYTKAKPQPYGMFPVLRDAGGRPRMWIDPRYRREGPDRAATLDVAFARVGPNSRGTAVENAVGGNRLVTGATFAHSRVTLIGYPSSAARPRVCFNRTTKFTSKEVRIPGSFLRIACTGYPGGTSGGPFLTRYNQRTGTGDVVGVIGGWKTGGTTPDISYSSYFGAQVRKLYQAAVSGARVG